MLIFNCSLIPIFLEFGSQKILLKIFRRYSKKNTKNTMLAWKKQAQCVVFVVACIGSLNMNMVIRAEPTQSQANYTLLKREKERGPFSISRVLCKENNHLFNQIDYGIIL